MKAMFWYDVRKDKWTCLYVVQEPFTPFVYDAKTAKRMLTKEGNRLYTHITVVDVDSYTFADGKYSVKISDNCDLPEIETLEERIENVRFRLRNYAT